MPGEYRKIRGGHSPPLPFPSFDCGERYRHITDYAPLPDPYLRIRAVDYEPVPVRRTVYRDVRFSVSIVVCRYRLVTTKRPLPNLDLSRCAVNDEPVAVRRAKHRYVGFSISIIVRRYRYISRKSPLPDLDLPC